MNHSLITCTHFKVSYFKRITNLKVTYKFSVIISIHLPRKNLISSYLVIRYRYQNHES